MINIPVFYTRFLGRAVSCPALCIPAVHVPLLLTVLEHEDFNFNLMSRKFICCAVVTTVKEMVGGRNSLKAADAFSNSVSNAIAPDCFITSYLYREFKLYSETSVLSDDDRRIQTSKLREDWVAHIIKHLKIGHKDGTPD